MGSENPLKEKNFFRKTNTKVKPILADLHTKEI
ncbi:hypothetical protein SAMN05216357_11937 [Porphyromonadaceae bacterium KH3CP3RA]|nr:hypothetical protein SAMN05216357_11937 [Porphyromonadaceae bacterium KH3CP3RA]